MEDLRFESGEEVSRDNGIIADPMEVLSDRTKPCRPR